MKLADITYVQFMYLRNVCYKAFDIFNGNAVINNEKNCN